MTTHTGPAAQHLADAIDVGCTRADEHDHIADHRAEVLNEAADCFDSADTCDCGGCDSCTIRRCAADLRRMANGDWPVLTWKDRADHARTKASRLQDRIDALELAEGLACTAERDALERVAELEARQAAVLTAHVQYPDSPHCQHDGSPWPCLTVAALTQDETPERTPLTVSRYDVPMEPAIEEDPVLTIGAIADDGRPVALLLDPENRVKVGRWITPATDDTESYPGELAMLRGLVATIRVTATHTSDMDEVRRLLDEHAADENDAYTGGTK
ncbi:hypothetical protein [Streptomyces sp. NPDC087272]|uniref:hypothetical protein n=1 Tax=Streptomyces sp. NPDC087272 TaxID=3365775 RepID=UPI00380E4C34